jgi:hypothetical protein
MVVGVFLSMAFKSCATDSMYRIGELNSAFSMRGLLGIDIHLIIFDGGFGHRIDHCFLQLSRYENLESTLSDF